MTETITIETHDHMGLEIDNFLSGICEDFDLDEIWFTTKTFSVAIGDFTKITVYVLEANPRASR